jgi:hypothetical protein
MNAQRPTDGGPIYVETNLSALFVEPWNAVSSLAIVFPALYWAIYLRGNVRNYGFLYYCIILLFLGGMGSTLYHAFRASRWLLWMDVLPTALLTLSVSIYLWHQITRRWWLTLLIVMPLLFFRIGGIQWLGLPFSINLSYLMTGIMIFLPVLIYLVMSHWEDWLLMACSVAFLLLSLFFRVKDGWFGEWLPMGSHFLWHLFSGVGAFFLGQYLFNLRQRKLT